MYVRILDLHSKIGSEAELARVLSQLATNLKVHAGYRDLTVFRSYCSPSLFVATSFWETKSAADAYAEVAYSAVETRLQPLLQQPIQIRTFAGDELLFARRLSRYLDCSEQVHKAP